MDRSAQHEVVTWAPPSEMNPSVIVIGAGMGGLTAAIRLAKAGFDVRVLEARKEPGGLASGVSCGGLSFDAGPYILLDRPGLQWAFETLGLDIAAKLPLLPIEDIYQVESRDGTLVRFHHNLDQTAAGFDRQWPGSGNRYKNFVRRMARISDSLRPMLRVSRPGVTDLVRSGAMLRAPFLMKSLATVLSGAGLPAPIAEAIAIWTHVAGQMKTEAPSPMAFVPALMHSAGAYYPEGGMRRIPEVLERAATAAGVCFQYGVKVARIRSEHGKTIGVETDAGDFTPAAAVLSNCGALGTYLQLLDLPPRQATRLRRLPLQSPGACAYLAVRGRVSSSYLRFRLGGRDEACRLLVQPSLVEHDQSRDDEWVPARLLAPMDYAGAEHAGSAGQCEYLDRLLGEEWWQKDFSDVRVLAKRTPQQWGSEYSLYASSMNPVMTARFMRQGRIAHRSPYVRGLYLAGSSTHPGQWVSFCAISGILAADCIVEDLN